MKYEEKLKDCLKNIQRLVVKTLAGYELKLHNIKMGSNFAAYGAFASILVHSIIAATKLCIWPKFFYRSIMCIVMNSLFFEKSNKRSGFDVTQIFNIYPPTINFENLFLTNWLFLENLKNLLMTMFLAMLSKGNTDM